MSRPLEGRTAFITGAGRGIGAAVAEAFAAAGARRLHLAARTLAELEATAARCAGAEVTVTVLDVGRRAAVEAAIAAAGEVDVLVNAAGIYGPIGPFVDNDLAGWEDAVAVNLMGTVYACHAVLPGMLGRGRGAIVNFSGGGATAPLPRFSSYAATKAAVVRLTETLAEECRDRGVRVNVIAPGAVDTRLQDEVLRAGAAAGPLHDRMREMRESGTGATPPEVPAALAVFLASDASDGLSGRLISAPHDGWREWTPERIRRIAESSWFTLRRLDPFTIDPLRDSRP